MFSGESRGKCVFYFAGSRSPFGWSVFRYTWSNCIICYQKKRKFWIQVLMNKKITPGYHGLTCLIPKEAEQRDLDWTKRCNHISSSPSLPGLPGKRNILLGSPAHVRDSRQPWTPADQHTDMRLLMNFSLQHSFKLCYLQAVGHTGYLQKGAVATAACS